MTVVCPQDFRYHEKGQAAAGLVNPCIRCWTMHTDSKRIYIAGPLFSLAERDFLERLVEEVATTLGLDPLRDFFLPHRDAGDVGPAHSRPAIFEADVRHLDTCEIVVAWLDGVDVDSGTAAEIGYAFALKKAVFGLLTDFRAYRHDTDQAWRINNMIWGMCRAGRRLFRTIEDLTSALQTSLEPAHEGR